MNALLEYIVDLFNLSGNIIKQLGGATFPLSFYIALFYILILAILANLSVVCSDLLLSCQCFGRCFCLFIFLKKILQKWLIPNWGAEYIFQRWNDVMTYDKYCQIQFSPIFSLYSFTCSLISKWLVISE